MIQARITEKSQGKNGDHPWSQTEASGTNHIFSHSILLNKGKNLLSTFQNVFLFAMSGIYTFGKSFWDKLMA